MDGGEDAANVRFLVVGEEDETRGHGVPTPVAFLA